MPRLSFKIYDDTWVYNIKPLSSKSDQNQFSPNNINTSSREKVLRISKMITKEN